MVPLTHIRVPSGSSLDRYHRIAPHDTAAGRCPEEGPEYLGDGIRNMMHRLFGAAIVFFAALIGPARAEIEVDWGSPQETCTADGSERSLIAPTAPPQEPLVSSDPGILTKLGKRHTINVAGPWLDRERNDVDDYGVVWHSWDSAPGGDAIWLREVLWVHYKPERLETSFRHHPPGLERFMTEESWQTLAEYGTSFRLTYEDPRYADYMAEVVANVLDATETDGVFLDWWIDNHPFLSEPEIRIARNRIAKAIRARIGPGPILMGNVGWTLETSTHEDLNAVFMELWKRPSSRGYSCEELARIEELLIVHDRYLAQPKIVVLEPWRQAKSSSSSDRKSKRNTEWATLFTAMAAVVPRNGYILYADNARDRSFDDHGHHFYDIYRTDLGEATSGFASVARGIGFKRFEKGIIAYNSTPADVTVQIDGQPLRLRPLTGVLCVEGDEGWDC